MKKTIISAVVFASMFVVGAVPNAQARKRASCSGRWSGASRRSASAGRM
jgi:hypothetical protein